MLRDSSDYYPDKEQTPEQHLIDLKVVMGAKTSFKKSVHDNLVAQQQWKHQEYGPIHRQYFIPLDYMAPDAFFEKFKNADDKQIVYWKRWCSVYEYYDMLSQDNPQYKKKVSKVNSRPNPNPRDYRPAQGKSIAYNPYAQGSSAPSDKWGKGLMSSTQGKSQINAWGVTTTATEIRSAQSTAPEIRSAQLTAPEIRSAPLSDKFRIESQVSIPFSQEQQQAAERTHRHRTNTSRSNIPVPTSDDSSQEDSDSLFDDKLQPADNNRIIRLRKEIKRIKGGQTYPTGYEKDRAREIKQAEENRIARLPVPAYLEGTKVPWSSGMGQANRHCDAHQVSLREATI
jgi:hypothetical protein